MEPSDAALVHACRRGDQSAWEALVTRYQRLVYSIPRRSGLTEEMAEDVFQQVFAMLVARIDQIEEPERVGAWLATTARRESWRVSRQASASRPLGDDEDDGVAALPDEGLLPEEALLRLERQHTIRTAVDALDERCRKLLTLLYYRVEPPPYAEIAAQLGTSEGSIGPTRARCFQKLRRSLEESQISQI